MLRLIPHIIVFSISENKSIIIKDIERWDEICYGKDVSISIIKKLVRLLTYYPEFRNLFYYRLGWIGRPLEILCRRMSTLYIRTSKIGPGLFIQHGFATIISAKIIGENCWINQQVTIGFSNGTDHPTIGNNVHISAGAKIIGNVTLGNNSIIGANAVVVKNVPPNTTVVGVPAYIIKRDGIKVRENLQ